MIHFPFVKSYSKPRCPLSETVMLIVSAETKGASLKPKVFRLPASRPFTRPPERRHQSMASSLSGDDNPGHQMSDLLNSNMPLGRGDDPVRTLKRRQ